MPCGLSARTFVHHPFYLSTGKSPPPRAIGKINPLRGRARARETSPAWGRFAYAKVTRGVEEGGEEGRSVLEVSRSPQYRPRGAPSLVSERSFGVRGSALRRAHPRARQIGDRK